METIFEYKSAINAISLILNSRNGLKFNEAVVTCLKKLYLFTDYIAPRQAGGDGGADFVVKSENRYFAMYSANDSSPRNNLKKIQSDLSTLTKTLYEEHGYTGVLGRFTFVVGTKSDEKSNDIYGEVEKCVNIFRDKYGYFEYDYWSSDDLCDQLLDGKLEYDDLIEIIMEYKLETYLTTPDISIEIQRILNEVQDQEENQNLFADYQRKSTRNKIKVNDLYDMEDEFSNALFTSPFFKIMESIVCEEKFNDKFNRFRDKVIQKFDKYYASGIRGSNIFDSIVNELIDKFVFSNKVARMMCIYLFDRCDIFDDELGEENDITQ